jgi:Cu/Ag efflux pump CusA
MWIGLSGALPPPGARRLRPLPPQGALQTVPGVGEVMMGGYLERNVRIWVDADKLDSKRAHGHRRDRRRSSASTSSCPAGPIETEGREINVRVLGEALDLDDPAADRRSATSTARRSTCPTSRSSRTASRTSGASRASTATPPRASASASSAERTRWRSPRGIKAAIAEIQKTLPEGMEVGINFDSTTVHRGLGPRDPVRAPPLRPPDGRSSAGCSSAPSPAR